MGIAASQARLLMITSYISDTEFAMQQISQKRTVLSYEAQTAAAENYTDMVAEYQQLDKQLETDLKSLETQHKMVTTEYESVKKTINDNIERSFKYNT